VCALDLLDQLREPVAGVGEGDDGHVSTLTRSGVKSVQYRGGTSPTALFRLPSSRRYWSRNVATLPG
jgi:hypothetical protein